MAYLPGKYGLFAVTCLLLAGTVPLSVQSAGPAPDNPAAGKILPAYRHAAPRPGQLTPAQAARQQVPRFAPDRVLVRFRPGTASGLRSQAHRAASARPLSEIPRIGVEVVQVPDGSVVQQLARYRANPNVEFAEPDYYHYTSIIPDEGNDPGPSNGGVVTGREYFQEQYGMHNTGQSHTSFHPVTGSPIQVSGVAGADINMPDAWDITTGSAAVKIAIADTGVDCASIEHTGKCVEEVNFVTDYSATTEDVVNHGTHVAGIAALHTNNSIGVAGVGWNSSIGNLKTCFEYLIDLLPPLGVYTYVGVCPVSASAAAIIHAADTGYHVINMSYGSDYLDENGDPLDYQLAQSNAETWAIDYAWNQGTVLVAAAGNNSDTDRMYPAANPKVIGVGATDHSDNLAAFSSYSIPSDHWVSLLAPGKDILSTIPVITCEFFAISEGYIFDPETEGCLTWNSGTSMASPHVAGAAALVWAQRFPGQAASGCSSTDGAPCNAVVRNMLETGADAAGAATQNMLAWSEHGRLNVEGALLVTVTDADGDGLADSVEAALGTDPGLADTDGDGMSDGDEVNSNASPPDTYTPGTETDPLDYDTDDDGMPDGTEVASGHDPLDASDSPVWGDTDGNGVVTLADFIRLRRAALGLDTLSPEEAARVDIAPVIAGSPQPDGNVGSGDLVVVEQILTGSASYP